MSASAIRLHRSNRMEMLVAALAQRVARDPLPPTQAEWIVVQGGAMQRWLSIRLSEYFGVVGNIQFPYPSTLIDRALDALAPLDVEGSALARGPMVWAIAETFTKHADIPAFAEVRRYLGEQDAELTSPKRFQLAEQVAHMFERYAVYRPELLQQWEQGGGQGWQPALWRALREQGMHVPTGARTQSFFSALTKEKGPISGLPSRVFLFGVSALPPLYMQMIGALASRVDLHLFALSPSQEFWADLQRPSRSLEDSETETGNPLLRSMGKLAGDFQLVLENNASYLETEQDLYVEPAPILATSTMLEVLQSDILHLRHRGKIHSDVEEERALPLPSGDTSVSIHSCHSSMRELEVLHDLLVAHLDAQPHLDALDIVVMVPNIESYAPQIEAVFGCATKDRPKLGYRIADRSDQSSFSTLQAFSQILSMLKGRMGATAVLDVLQLQVVRDRFGIEEDELPIIGEWVAGAGIRWGVDGRDREVVGQPNCSENTWRFGLDRLLFGYAFQSDGVLMFEGVVAYDDMEGTKVDLLGRFLDFCDRLFALRERVATPARMEEWAPWLLDCLEGLIDVNDVNISEHQLVRKTIAELNEDVLRVDAQGAIPFDTLRSHLESKWKVAGSVRGFLSGGITFCQLMPMRSIPFQVVCLLGMSDGEFPRSVAMMEFDHMAENPRLGDRNVRDDDRYLFLEAILAARKSLIITYVGRSVKNNTVIAPSVLVGELLDVLEDTFVGGQGDVRESLVTEHPLQPFSPVYFEANETSGLFSYSTAFCDGAKSILVADKGDPPRFFESPLPREEEESAIRISDLVQYFRGATRFLLERRLGLFLREEESSLRDREPMEMAGLDTWDVANRVLSHLLRDLNAEVSSMDFHDAMRASGDIPLGMVGTCWFEGISESITALQEGARRVCIGDARDSLAIDCMVDGARIVGTIGDLWPTGRVLVSFSRTEKSSDLGHWIQHLFLCLAGPEGVEKKTHVVGRAVSGNAIQTAEFAEVEEPARILKTLVEIYKLGQTLPLPFFPEAGRKFVKGLKGRDIDLSLDDLGVEGFEKALASARGMYEGTLFGGESLDPYVQKAFGADRCLEPGYRPFEGAEGYLSFPVLSSLVFSPLLAHRRGTKG